MGMKDFAKHMTKSKHVPLITVLLSQKTRRLKLQKLDRS